MSCDSSSQRQNFTLTVKVGYQVREAQSIVRKMCHAMQTGVTTANHHAHSHAALITAQHPSPAWEQVMRLRNYESVTKCTGFFSPSLVYCALRYEKQISS
jgi:hypothetical protein